MTASVTTGDNKGNKKICSQIKKEIDGWYVVNGRIDSDERLEVTGTASIIIVDGSRLYLEDGINVPAGKTLNIYGQRGGSGELYCR